MRTTRGVRAMLRTLVAVAFAFIIRYFLDFLIGKFPENAQYIDTIGQFLVAVIVVWFFIIPIFEDYGVILNKNSEK